MEVFVWRLFLLVIDLSFEKMVTSVSVGCESMC